MYLLKPDIFKKFPLFLNVFFFFFFFRVLTFVEPFRAKQYPFLLDILVPFIVLCMITVNVCSFLFFP